MPNQIKSNLVQVVKDLNDKAKSIEETKKKALGKIVNLTFQLAADKQILKGSFVGPLGYTQVPGGDIMGTIKYRNGATGRIQRRRAPKFISGKIVSRSGETYNLYTAMGKEDFSIDNDYSPFEVQHTKNGLTVSMDGTKLAKKIWSIERGGTGKRARNSLRKSLNSVWRRFAKVWKDLSGV